MSRRLFYRKCDAAGCTHSDLIEPIDSQDRADTLKKPHFCLRHDGRAWWLTAGTKAASQCMTAVRAEGCGDKLFWRDERTGKLGSGFIAGFGFRTDANDFPEGTYMRVTVEVTTPKPDPAPDDAPAVEAGP